MRTIIWEKSPWSEEEGEFKRVIVDYSGDSKQAYKDNLRELKRLYSTATPSTLTDSDWKKFKNTDSWTTDIVRKMENALIRNRESRDVKRIFYQYASLRVSCPIAIRLDSGVLELVGGNTRLMAARVLDINPKIIILTTDW